MSTSKEAKPPSAPNHASDGHAPSSTFRIRLQSPNPSDPRTELPALAAVVSDYRRNNDRMALGLKIGFREVENRFGRRPTRQS